MSATYRQATHISWEYDLKADVLLIASQNCHMRKIGDW